MTATELMEYVKNPTKITIRQFSEETRIQVRSNPSFMAATVNSSYAMGIVHAFNRLEINFMAGVDNKATLQEFRDWLKELGVDIDKQYLD